MKKFLFLNVFVLLSLLISFAQNSNGGFFNSDKFKFSQKYFFKDINQKSIKAVRIAIRKISAIDSVNSYLFYPSKPNGNQLGLFDFMMTLANEKKIKLYNFKTSFFKNEITSTEVYEIAKKTNKYRSQFSELEQVDTSMTIEFNSSSIKNFYVMESVIIGNNDRVIETRPIGLCPILNDTLAQFVINDSIGYDFWEKPLFWIYFPDIMPYLAFHMPKNEVKGFKNTLDFFVKNKYIGALDKFMHFDFDNVDIDVSMEAKGFNTEGFNIQWIYDAIDSGRYVDKFNKKYQGNSGINEQTRNFEIEKDSSLNVDVIHSARYVYKTIDLRKPENYPLHFPYTPSFGQMSLIDVLIEGIRNHSFTAYVDDVSFEPLSIGRLDSLLIENNRILIFDDLYGDYTHDTVVQDIIPVSDVHKFILKEVEFFDIKGNLIHKRVLGLSAYLKINNNSDIQEDYAHISVSDATFRKLFYVPLTDTSVRFSLLQHDAYRFDSYNNLSLYSFLKNEKFKVDTLDLLPVSVNTALWELNQKPKIDTNGNLQKNSLNFDSNINDILCAKYLYHTIDLQNYENRCLYQSVDDFQNQKCLIELIMDAIKAEKITVFVDDNAIIYSQAVNLLSTYVSYYVNDDFNMPNIDTILVYNPKTTVTKYCVKEVVFYNSLGVNLGSKILGFYPVYQSEKSMYDNDNVFYNDENSFYIKLNKPDVQKFLNDNYAYKFKNGFQISYLSFFNEKKYTVEKVKEEPVGIELALKEYGINPEKYNENLDSKNSLNYNEFLPFDTIKSPKLVFRVIEYDTLNYKYFNTILSKSGMYTFSEFLSNLLQINQLKTYEYNPDGVFEKNITKEDINKQIIQLLRLVTFSDIDYNTGSYLISDSALLNFDYVKRFIIKELHVGEKVFIIGICPVLNYEAEPTLYFDKELFWTPFNIEIRKEMTKKEVFKLNCEAERSIWDCFQNRSYNGTIISEKTISVQDAETLILELK